MSSPAQRERKGTHRSFSVGGVGEGIAQEEVPSPIPLRFRVAGPFPLPQAGEDFTSPASSISPSTNLDSSLAPSLTKAPYTEERAG
jgi:hypothetical protein